VRTNASVAGRMATPLADRGRNICRRARVYCGAHGLSVSRLRLSSSSQLCLLPGGIVPLDEAWIYGSDLSADRCHVEAVVWLPARAFCGFSRFSCGSLRVESVMEKSSNPRRCCCGVGRCRLLLSVQRFVLGVGWRMVVRTTLPECGTAAAVCRAGAGLE